MLKICIIAGCIYVGLVLLWFLAVTILFCYIFCRRDGKIFDSIDLTGTHYEPYVEQINADIARLRGEPYETLTMTSRDGLKLAGRYYDRGSSRTVIMVHGYHSQPLNNFCALAPTLLDRGYNILFPIMRGHLESRGVLTTMGLKEQYDVLDWADKAGELPGVTDIAIYGTSMGGATVSYLSDKVENEKVKVLAADCGFTSPYGQFKHLFSPPLLAAGVPVLWLWGKVLMRADFRRRNTDCVKKAVRPMCFIHGEKDDYIPVQQSEVNYEVCPTEKKLLTVPGAGHTASMLVGGAEAQESLIAFMERFMTENPKN